MVLLILGVVPIVPWYVHTMLGIGIGFFYVYQIIDAVRTAKADPVGRTCARSLRAWHQCSAASGATTPAGERTSEPTKVPIAAVVLIGLGVLFLINTAFRLQPASLIGR